MTRQEIEAVFERVKTWPPERQAYAAYLLRGLEQEEVEPLELSEEEQAALDEAEAEADRGEFATDEEVEALPAKYRTL